MLSITEIMRALPHKYPFLFCDRILEHDYLQSVTGIKNITVNEPYFQGHFPNNPIMPGVLILESMAQIGGFIFYNPEDNKDKIAGEIVKIDNAKFFHPAFPGDVLAVKAVFMESHGQYGKIKATASINNRKTAGAEITYFFPNKTGDEV